MLLELHISNFAIAERVDLSFEAGFNVLTGETGAGKSIVVDAILFLLGGRAGTDMIRTGAEYCRAEALFDIAPLSALKELLAEEGIEPEDQLVVSRELNAAGRSRCRVNGRLVTVALLGRIGEHLVSVHGQHEHQSLLRPERHLDWLDLYAGEEALRQAEAVADLWRRYSETVRSLARWEEESRERERRRDLLRYQLEEIERAKLRVGEEEELQALRRRLANAERLLERLSTAYGLLCEGAAHAAPALDLLGQSAALLTEAAEWAPELRGAVELLESAFAQAQEAAHMLRQQRDGVEADPAELARIEERLALIAQLRKKYGPDVAAILQYRDRIAAELASDELSEAAYEQLAARRQELERKLGAAAVRLSSLRREAAQRLSAEMKAELAELAFDGAEFIVQVDREPSDGPEGVTVGGTRYACTARGIDRVAFLFSANPGEEPRPLAKVASGGELSRLMLALKSLLARYDRVPTLIFDEVDAGIGGRTATAVAKRLARLARAHQVLAVTHLAQIACVADHHLQVVKRTKDGRTHTEVHALSHEERVREIARMLDGTASETTLQRARELLAAGER